MKKKTHFVSLLALSLAGLASHPARAETSADDYDGIIVTASRVVTEARQIGSAVTVVTEEDIRRTQAVFVKELLQDIAGVQLSSDRPGDFTSVSIRGSDNDHLLWLIDGIRLGDPSSISREFQPDHLVSRDIARMEVLHGNQSSLYGSDAIGGVVNIITQRAAEDGVRVNAEGEAGSHGTVNGGASVLGKAGALDFRLTATGYSHDGPSYADPRTGNAANPVTENDGYWRYGLNGRAGVAVSDTLSFQLVGFWQKARSNLDDTTYYDYLTDEIYSVDNFTTVRKREYAGAAQANFVSADGKLRADASISRFVSRRLHFGNPSNLPEGDKYKGTLDTAHLNLGYDGGIWSVAAGGNWQREKSDQRVGDWMTGDPVPFAASITTRAAYAELALRPTENLTLTGAARIDDNSRFGSFDTYRGTISYVVPGALGADSVKFRASYGTGAKAPSLYQLFDPTYGNPDLQAETSRGGDVGVDMNFDRFSAQLSWFFNRNSNEIGWDGIYRQYGRTRKQGIEVAFVLEPTPWATIRQSFTYLEAESDPNRDGVYQNMGRPKHSGSTSLTLTPVERLSLTARARYRDRNDASYGGSTPAYAVVDLLGSYGITDAIEIHGRVVNLFDKWYQLSYGTNTLGLSAYGGVRVSF
ncbi:MAG: hypothetical protein CVT74_12915 [Alphaproteobacteria bacterium HGW-Alphaproteobacteria-13]|nr:MAG: hypothetical protein CVT74_12915 [Alphaproteobacteria bacterium HGW-Alphaproteobacteria-13]